MAVLPSIMTLLDAIRALTPHSFKKAVVHGLAAGPIDGVLNRVFPAGIPHYGSRIPATRRGMASRLFFGFYERSEIFMTRKFLPEGMDVIELGGSAGANTCLIARKSRRVVTVEADMHLAERLIDTIAMNSLHNVTVVAKAIAVGRDSVQFEAGATNLGGRLAEHGVTVPATSLSALLETHDFGDYALVSDCEGAEAEILLHDEGALRHCKVALVEMGGLGHTPDDIEAMFLAQGFARRYRYGPCAAFVRP